MNYDRSLPTVKVKVDRNGSNQHNYNYDEELEIKDPKEMNLLRITFDVLSEWIHQIKQSASDKKVSIKLN